jgi:excisionase family DNA binding protein
LPESPDGIRWIVKYYYAPGKQTTKTLGSKTQINRKQAEMMREELVRPLNQSPFRSLRQDTFENFIEDVFLPMKRESGEWRENTENGLQVAGVKTQMFDQQFLKEIRDVVKDAVSQALPASKRLFTLEEAAEYIGRSPKAVERLIQRGTIPVTKIDGKRQVDRAALDKIISDRTFFEV